MAQHPKKIDYLVQRRHQGLTHAELGQEFGVSRQHVGRLLEKHASKANEPEKETY